MFWGRLASRQAEVPIVCSALHSSGWPDEIGWLNRRLSAITTGFIACAKKHAQYLVEQERLPAERVFVIPNGVDTDRFRPNHSLRGRLRSELGLPLDCPLVGIVAALREEKNHLQFVAAAKETLRQHATAHFVIVGEGPEQAKIEAAIREQGLSTRIHLLGYRGDTERILAALDVACLTSRNEANPVSILEALSCGVPVVSANVGSVSETVIPQQTGLLTRPSCSESTADAVTQLLGDPVRARHMGLAGRQLVRNHCSLEAMVGGYEKLIGMLYNVHAEVTGKPLWSKVTELSAELPKVLVPAELDSPAAFGSACQTSC
jgi:glycosyltransferase involved in cell wall biosynthesis